MSWEADLDRATLSILLDLRHPHAYLALGPAVALAEAQGIEINWLPVTAPALRPPGPDGDRAVRHRRIRAQALVRGIEAYAEAQGLVIRDCYRDGDASAAQLGWLWVRHHHPGALVGYLRALFRGYWGLTLDASSLPEVAALVDPIGGDGGDFRAWAEGPGPGVLEALSAELGNRAGRESPIYLLEGEIFLGRQHLPMIEWILGGRQGPGPI